MKHHKIVTSGKYDAILCYGSRWMHWFYKKIAVKYNHERIFHYPFVA